MIADILSGITQSRGMGIPWRWSERKGEGEPTLNLRGRLVRPSQVEAGVRQIFSVLSNNIISSYFSTGLLSFLLSNVVGSENITIRIDITKIQICW